MSQLAEVNIFCAPSFHILNKALINHFREHFSNKKTLSDNEKTDFFVYCAGEF